MTSKYAVIQYPGIVQNVDKALVTLGGIAKMSQDYFKGRSLTINYHPENLYSKPTIARRKEATFLIIHVRRKKSTSVDASTSAQQSLEVKVLGVASALHHFNVMFDFQFLPVKRIFKTDTQMEKRTNGGEEEAIFENLLPKLYPHSIEESLTWLDDDEERENSTDLFLPPVAFSRIYASAPFILCRDVERRMPMPKNMPMGSKMRLPRKAAAIQVMSTDVEFPSKPTDEAVKKCQSYSEKLSHITTKIEQIYQERPLWTKSALYYRTQFTDFIIKEVVPAYAFYISSGPFGRCWSKFGYDYRTDPSSRRYQVIIYTERGPSFSAIPRKDASRISKQTSVLSSVLPNEFDIYPESISVFKPGERPLFRQMYYQLCDIKLPIVEEILRTPAPLTCDPLTGWLTEEQIEALRVAIRKEVEQNKDERPTLDIDMDDEFP